MKSEKTPAVILSAMPYRESSLILCLFTRVQGMAHGMAKGVRKQSLRSVPVERGFLVELFLYVKHGRDLHTLGDIQIADGFLSIRADLERTALRDIAFEMILKSIGSADPHPELFDYLVAFLEKLDSVSGRTMAFGALWHFFYEFSGLLGFRLNIEECVACGNPVGHENALNLAIDRGGLICQNCSRSISGYMPIRPEVIHLFAAQALPAEAFLQLDKKELIRITRLLASYCRYHLETRGDFKALDFLENMLLRN